MDPIKIELLTTEGTVKDWTFDFGDQSDPLFEGLTDMLSACEQHVYNYARSDERYQRQAAEHVAMCKALTDKCDAIRAALDALIEAGDYVFWAMCDQMSETSRDKLTQALAAAKEARGGE
jgi:hypothetical protein